MDIYDAIFYRRSIKKYSNKRISKDLMQVIKDITDSLDSLDKDIDIQAHIIEREDKIKKNKTFRLNAPYYILLTSEQKEGYLQNAGYTLHKVLLELVTLGLGTCWVESSLNIKDIGDNIGIKEGHIPVTMIAFGYADKNEKLFRKDIEEFKRRSIKDICKRVDSNWKDILEAARLAPSFKNSQPWFFYQGNGCINLYRKIGMHKGKLEYMNKIDIGIVLRHIHISGEHYKRDVYTKKLGLKDKLAKSYEISIIPKS
jgi:nitroreductase